MPCKNQKDLFQTTLGETKVLDDSLLTHRVQLLEQSTQLERRCIGDLEDQFTRTSVHVRVLLHLRAHLEHLLLHCFTVLSMNQHDRHAVALALLPAQFLRRPNDYNPPVDQDAHAVTELLCFLHPVCREHLGGVLQFAENFNGAPQFESGHRVYASSGFV